jgi:hypothetical protein
MRGLAGADHPIVPSSMRRESAQRGVVNATRTSRKRSGDLAHRKKGEANAKREFVIFG